MRQEKQLLLDEIKGKIKASKAVVFTRYQNLKAKSETAFRTLLRRAGGDFEVVPKRVFLKAAQEEGMQLDQDMLPGHIGIVFALGDAIETTKAIIQYGKESDNAVVVVGGHFEGMLCNAKEMEKIATLPSKEEMRAQFLGLLTAPMAQTLGVMDAQLTSILYCLENKAAKEGTE
jgi:large subunit ribosomal protein L10